ncbi:NUDIX hydrolase [Balneolaceae bacterium ANBcel3]|nr:NUDIX hydrolase [Balneolaceae bacterium ANBcel3]
MNAKESKRYLEEKKINSTPVYKGNLLHVYKDRVELPDGKESEREWIDHPGASAVIPVFETGEIQLVRQFRYPVGKTFYEIPAGKIDRGEDPLAAAQRELLEETGIRGTHWVSLGIFHPVIGYSNEVIYLYLTWGIDQNQANADADEFVTPVKYPFQKAVDLVMNGEFTDGKTMAGIIKAANWWKKQGPFSIPLKL